ncbi:hypothetical protein B0O99DRAFT_664485 [Bisporella sp. PMI_857]|nr:hypothetical protein B0O99DRAFT_664485 [Bisporella sp. PMI_857]
MKALHMVSYKSTITAVNTGSFSNPDPVVRPRFRYWLPDASVDADIVAADILAAGAVGAGGIELLPFYEYGGALGSMPLGANWSSYNFGTGPFRDLFSAALTAHEQNGLVMDFALGPNQGQGVPASPVDPGLQWDLIPSTAAVPSNGSFRGTIPGWGTGELVALVSALVTSNSTITYEATGLVAATNVTYDQYILASDSLLDQTEQVSGDGTVELFFPQTANGQHYRLFTFCQKLSGNKNLEFSSTVNNSIFDEGSYVVDHFDAKGAETIINFWEEYILSDGVREQLRRVGHYAWEDSLEIISNISWSRSIPTRFEKIFGYKIKPILPLLTFQQNSLGIQTTAPGPFQCILDTKDQGVEYVNDFRATLVAGYQEYIQTLKKWVNDELGLQLSVQPAYGLPMDMQASIPYVDAPECESLSFLDLIDSYRQFVGPANLAGKRVISNELGAVRWSAFRYHVPELLFSANRGFASGLNQYVLHGQAYSGNYYQTTWPGHVPFNYLFSEPWSPRQPVWSHGLREALDYMARVQYLQQSGVPKVDVAIYNKESATTIRTVYASTDLADAGWSYNYLGPENLNSLQAIVDNGVLAPAGPAWKALIVTSISNVSLNAIASLQKFANRGLPVIFVGGSPHFYPTGNDTSVASFEEQLQVLQASKNVYSVEEEQVASHLSSLGLAPRVAASTNGTWFTTWRESNGSGHALIYSDLVASQGKVTITDTRTPFFLNPWSGEQAPVLIYEQNSTSTTIPLSLAGNQTTIILFSNLQRSSMVPAYHVTFAPSSVIGSTFNSERGLALHVIASSTDEEAVLSNGATCNLSGPSVPAPFQLSDWILTAEHWEAPSNMSKAMEPTTKFNTTHLLHSLTSWAEIPALTNTSGIGYYTSTFEWPPTKICGNITELGAYISFENVLHSLRVQVNGHQLPPLDITNAVADISPYLRPGNNTVTATVSTTWWNYFRTILDTLKSSGATPLPLMAVSCRE